MGRYTRHRDRDRARTRARNVTHKTPICIHASRAPSRRRPRARSTPSVDVIHPAAALSTGALYAPRRVVVGHHAHRATPSRRRARARVKDKKYHHPSIRARIARAPIARASPLAITPSATDDVASPRIASHRNHRRRRRPANGDHRHLSHTHIYIRTVAFTRRCTTADRAVSELDIVVVGAREVK